MKRVSSSSTILLLFVVAALPCSCNSFAPITATKKRLPFFRSVATDDTTSTTTVEPSTSPPSWDELAAVLENVFPKLQREPLVTLYRDNNGWCPFCERVWVALRAKDIEYQETLVSLQNKPDWYKQLVPTTLVPAVLFHNQDPEKKERTIVWESMDILKALDKQFPDTPQLVLDTPEFHEALEMNEELSKAGVAFVYAGRNDTLTPKDMDERRAAFEEQLDKLDAALAANTEGHFRLGKSFTGMDCIMIPTLERWRYQLAITTEFDILGKRLALKQWFDAMDAYAPYSSRVAGDEYSWTATASMFLRYFGGGEDKPEVAAAIERADKAAEEMSKSFAKADTVNQSFAVEAAAKLVSNHDAVVKDGARHDPLSQKHIPRASREETVDVVLRYVASILLSEKDSLEIARSAPLVQVSDALDGAVAARTVACRTCVPRDMSAPAAAALRAVLAIVADRFDGE